MTFADEPGQKTNKAKVTANNDPDLMAMDPANYLVNPLKLEKLVAVEPIDPGVEGQDLCDTAGKPEEMVFRYRPGIGFNPGQPSGKAAIIVDNGPDDDNTAYIIVSDKSSDPLSGKVFFKGDVNVGEDFSASIANAGGSFASNTFIYFYDDQGGPLLQQVQYHTSCSAPIILGADILSAELIGYDGENGGLVSMPDPESDFVDADSPFTAPEAVIDTTVRFRYEVSNMGDAPLSNVNVTDDRLDDVIFVGGDDNNNNQLDTDEVWIYEASEIAQEGLITNKGTATAQLNGTELMAMDPANYTGIELPPPAGDVCETLGKPEAITFQYDPGDTVLTGGKNNNQDGKAKIKTSIPSPVDNDGTSFIIVTEENDAAKIRKEYVQDGKTDKIHFAGNVDFGEYFLANEATNDFGSTTYIHFFDEQNGGDQGLLQTIEYHTSCSQPIQIGDVIGNATLVEYFGEQGAFNSPSINPMDLVI
jgi:hypothetical protein